MRKWQSARRWLLCVLAARLGAADVELSLLDAVERALRTEGNLQLQLSREQLQRAGSLARQARAALLPHAAAGTSYDSRTVNLRAFGVRFEIPGAPFAVPSFVGPFSVFDARVRASQQLFDLSAIERYRAMKAASQGSELEIRFVEQQVMTQVATAYLAVQRAAAQLDAARADLALAERLYELAEDRRRAAAATRLDVTRASLQRARAEQRRIAAEHALREVELQLLRLLNLELEDRLRLTDPIAFHPLPAWSEAEAVELALKSRPDWLAEQKRLREAELRYRAARAERLPKVNAFADYGAIGSGPGEALPTRSVGVRLELPLFDGGGIEARTSEAASLWRAEQVRARDLRAQIELEVRVALDAARTAAKQVQVAREASQLAQQELEQAERRFRAGISTNVEIVDAQARLARARQEEIDALFGHEVARLELGRAVGAIQEFISGRPVR